MNKKKTFCIIGMGTFGLSVAKQLTDLKFDVMVIDKNYDIINSLNNKFNTAVAADATSINALKSLGIENLDTVVVAIRDFETSIYVCTNLKELNIPNIITYAKSSVQMKILKNIGATSVITPEINSAITLSLNLSSSIDIQDSFVGEGYTLIKVFMNKFDEGISIKKIYTDFDFIDIFCIKRGNRILFGNNVQKIEIGDLLYIACESKNIPNIVQYFYKTIEKQ
ncbi:TrkA family potassium uptake protein [bacterium]|nr:TrkA family potassium uptake protein [bacterium]